MRKLIAVLFFILVLVGCRSTDNSAKTTDFIDSPSGQSQGTYTPDESLSEDIKSYNVQINDDVYAFPMDYEDFIDNGWSIESKYASEEDFVDSYCTEIVWFNLDDNNKANFYVYNPDVSDQPIKNCVISGVTLDCRLDMQDAAIFIPKGLQLGVATLNDVKAAFGKPDNITEVKEGVLVYEFNVGNGWSSTRMWFRDNILVEYIINNPTATENYSYSDPTDLEVTYDAPSALSNSLEDRIVYFGNALYKLPAPVSAFMENGWIPEDESTVVSADGLAHIIMKRASDDKEITVTVYNYSDKACTVKDAFVEELSSTDLYGEEFAVSDEINMNSSEEDVKTFLDSGKYNYKFEESNFSKRYAVQLSGDVWNNFCSIAFDKEKKIISYITISSNN